MQKKILLFESIYLQMIYHSIFLGETNKMKEAFDKRRLLALDIFNNLENVKISKPNGAFYLFPDVSYYCNETIKNVSNSIDFCNWLLDEHYIAFVPGEVFGAEGYLRCSYALSDNDLNEGLSRFSEAVKNL